MYLSSFEDILLKNTSADCIPINIKEFKIIKYKLDDGSILKLKVKDEKVYRIEANGTNAEKILEIYVKNTKKS